MGSGSKNRALRIRSDVEVGGLTSGNDSTGPGVHAGLQPVSPRIPKTSLRRAGFHVPRRCRRPGSREVHVGVLRSNAEMHRDTGAAPALAITSTGPTVATPALLDKDGSTDIDVIVGTFDAPSPAATITKPESKTGCGRTGTTSSTKLSTSSFTMTRAGAIHGQALDITATLKVRKTATTVPAIVTPVTCRPDLGVEIHAKNGNHGALTTASTAPMMTCAALVGLRFDRMQLHRRLLSGPSNCRTRG
jgi:hypothetical protein